MSTCCTNEELQKKIDDAFAAGDPCTALQALRPEIVKKQAFLISCMDGSTGFADESTDHAGQLQALQMMLDSIERYCGRTQPAHIVGGVVSCGDGYRKYAYGGCGGRWGC